MRAVAIMKIKQVVVTGQRQVQLQQDDLPSGPLGPDELLIETEWTFISAGTELANYTGRDPDVFKPGRWCSYPWKSGYANVGRVRETGAAVSRVKVGDRVFSYGNHASAVRYTQDRLVLPAPEGMDPAITASSRMAGVSLTAIIVAEIRANPWVAVFGLGAVGNLAAQAFAARGCRVIGVDPVEFRRKLAATCGIAHTVGGTPEEAHEGVLKLTGGAGADITVDAVGHSAVVQQAARATAPHGQVVILGTPRVPVNDDLTPLLTDVHRRFLTIRGALEWGIPFYPQTGKPDSQYAKQLQIFDWMQRGLLKLEPLLSHRMKPQQIKDAYEGLLNRPETFTGVALDWTDASG